MGSNSSKTKDLSVGKTKKGTTKVELDGGDNMPDVLVSILRQKAVLISEGVSVATQTDETGFEMKDYMLHPTPSCSWNENTIGNGALNVNSELNIASAVNYDLETSGHQTKNAGTSDDIKTNVAGIIEKDPLSGDSTATELEPSNKNAPTVGVKPRRERSDMSTNTTVTAIPASQVVRDRSGYRDSRENPHIEQRKGTDTSESGFSLDTSGNTQTEQRKGSEDNTKTGQTNVGLESPAQGFSKDTREITSTEHRKDASTDATNPTPGATIDYDVVDETNPETGYSNEHPKPGTNPKHAIPKSSINDGVTPSLMLDSGTVPENKHKIHEDETTEGVTKSHEETNSIDSPHLERYGKYRVRVEGDKQKCTISAVTFLDTGDLVLIDRSNKNIKYVDSEFRYISAHNLPAQPWAVCARGVDVYVTIGNTQIQHLYVKDMLIEPERLFEVKGRCLGICMYGEHIAVGLQIGEIHLLDTIGEVQKTIKLPILDNGKACNPWHLNVSKEQNLLITDSDAGTVFCINKDAQLVCKFSDMSSPRCATVDCHGNVIVVGRDNETGVVVTLIPRDWELGGILHMEQRAIATGGKALLSWRDLEFVPYCVDFRNDGVLVMGGIRESLKIMKLKH